jgi:tetratricopeptide (TPR) repeat protein
VGSDRHEGRGYVLIDKDVSDWRMRNRITCRARKLYITYTMMGRVLRSRLGEKLGAPGEVTGYLENASRLADKMAAADPDNRSALSDVAAAGASLGERLRSEKQLPEAIAAFTKGVVAAERLNTLSGQVSGNEDMLVHVHERLAQGLIDAARYEDAFGHLAKAEEYLGLAEKRNSGLNRNALGLCEIVDAKADAYVAQQRWQEAAAAYRRQITIFDSEEKRDPKNEVYLNERPRLYAGLAKSYASMSQWPQAVDAIQGALERFREIEMKRPLAEGEQADRVTANAHLLEWRTRL